MHVQTGGWKDSDSVLALYRFHMTASETQLSDLGIHRDEIKKLIYSLEADDSGYRQTELATIAEQMLRAYVAGKAVK